MALDSIEWAVSDGAQTDEPDAGQKANGWTASATADSQNINWLWREQATHLLWAEHQTDLFDSIIKNPT
jgi:hypothetical protein